MGHHYVERDIMHLRRRSQQQQIQQLDRKVRDQGTELERRSQMKPVCESESSLLYHVHKLFGLKGGEVERAEGIDPRLDRGKVTFYH